MIFWRISPSSWNPLLEQAEPRTFWTMAYDWNIFVHMKPVTIPPDPIILVRKPEAPFSYTEGYLPISVLI